MAINYRVFLHSHWGFNSSSVLLYGERGYWVRPRESVGELPGVLVVHENRGLNPHIEDVTRRFALAGFAALAPDALTPLGGYPGGEDEARALFQKLESSLWIVQPEGDASPMPPSVKENDP